MAMSLKFYGVLNTPTPVLAIKSGLTDPNMFATELIQAWKETSVIS